MLSASQLAALNGFLCPSCQRPLGRYHAYPVPLETLISRLTESVPMHKECAEAYHELTQPQADTDVSVVWIVKSSSPDAPSARLFAKDEGDLWLHLQTPDSIVFRTLGQPSTYEEIMDAMALPLSEALGKAQGNEDEMTSLKQQIAWLQRYMPARPPGLFDDLQPAT